MKTVKFSADTICPHYNLSRYIVDSVVMISIMAPEIISRQGIKLLLHVHLRISVSFHK